MYVGGLVDQIKLHYVFGQTDLRKQCKARSSTRRLIRVYNVCHSSSNFKQFTGSKMDLMEF